MAGPCAKVNLALSEEPRFTGTPAKYTPLERTFYTLVPSLEFAERCYDVAKFGEIPEQLWIDCVIASNADASLGAAGHAHHDLFRCSTCPFICDQGTWDDHRELLGDRVVAHHW